MTGAVVAAGSMGLVGLLAALFVAALLLIKPYWHEGPVHEAIEDTGLILVFFAILGRLWSILYIGAHKNRHLVEIGPYSMTRNPLYLSSLLGILGVGLMFGSLVVAIGICRSIIAAAPANIIFNAINPSLKSRGS